MRNILGQGEFEKQIKMINQHVVAMTMDPMMFEKVLNNLVFNIHFLIFRLRLCQCKRGIEKFQVPSGRANGVNRSCVRDKKIALVERIMLASMIKIALSGNDDTSFKKSVLVGRVILPVVKCSNGTLGFSENQMVVLMVHKLMGLRPRLTCPP